MATFVHLPALLGLVLEALEGCLGGRGRGEALFWAWRTENGTDRAVLDGQSGAGGAGTALADAGLRKRGEPWLRDVPLEPLQELLTVRDFVRLARTSRAMREWAVRALGNKRTLHDEDVRAMLLCPRVESLKWTKSSARMVLDASIKLAICALPNLRSLCLCDLDSVTDAAFDNLPPLHLERLELVNMRHIEATSLFEALLAGQSALTTIRIERCPKVSASGPLARLIGPSLVSLSLKSFPPTRRLMLDDLRECLELASNLVSLDLSSSHMEGRFVSCVLPLFPRLEHLDVNYVSTLYDEDFSDMQTYVLKRLTVNSSENLSDEGLKWMLRPSLGHLNLSQTAVSDEGIELLTQLCPDLEVLYLGACWEITSQGIKLAALCLPRLRELGFSRCGQIQDEVAEALARGAALHSIAMLNCNGITSNAVLTLLNESEQIGKVKCSVLNHIDVERILEQARRRVTVTSIDEDSSDYLFTIERNALVG